MVLHRPGLWSAGRTLRQFLPHQSLIPSQSVRVVVLTLYLDGCLGQSETRKVDTGQVWSVLLPSLPEGAPD